MSRDNRLAEIRERLANRYWPGEHFPHDVRNAKQAKQFGADVAYLLELVGQFRELCRDELQDRQCSQMCDGPHNGCHCWYCRTCTFLARIGK